MWNSRPHPLHDDEQLEALASKVCGADVVERGVLIDHMDEVQGPDEEHTRFTCSVGVHLCNKSAFQTEKYITPTLWLLTLIIFISWYISPSSVILLLRVFTEI